jgi:tetratricopeptide (TPR) repeat protein
LVLIGANLVLEVWELPFGIRRAAAQDRLKRIAPWLLSSIAVTVVNPWGPAIYTGILRQNRSVKELGDFIGEWSKPNLSVSVFHQMFNWRNPESSFWWLLLFAAIAFVLALWRRQFGAAILLGGATFLSVQYLRFQGLFACMAVIIGGAIIDECWRPQVSDPNAVPRPLRYTGGVTLAICAVITVLTVVRCVDLIDNRHYIEAGEVVLFGPGEASWFPERAAQFVLDHRLPQGLFNDYNLGGFLDWRLPQYKTYVDSRAIPFGVTLLTHERTLLALPLDSPEWAKEADERQINLVVISVDRYTGLGKVPLDSDCASHNWRPVYLDQTGAVFLRNTAANAALIQQLAIDCKTVQLSQPAEARGNGFRARANAYNFFSNAGALFYLLGRDREALQYLAQASQIQSHDSNLHLTLAQLYQADGQLADAEHEYKLSIAQRSTDFAWYLLGILYGREHRYAEAVTAMTRAAEISYDPADRIRVVGQIENAMQQPREALSSFDRAERIGSRGSVEDRKLFQAQLASGRARSWELLHDLDRAIQEQRKSVDLLPDDASRWATLAQLYREKGNAADAVNAQAKADSLKMR